MASFNFNQNGYLDKRLHEIKELKEKYQQEEYLLHLNFFRDLRTFVEDNMDKFIVVNDHYYIMVKDKMETLFRGHGSRGVISSFFIEGVVIDTDAKIFKDAFRGTLKISMTDILKEITRDAFYNALSVMTRRVLEDKNEVDFIKDVLEYGYPANAVQVIKDYPRLFSDKLREYALNLETSEEV